jgi:hypothetical protein
MRKSKSKAQLKASKKEAFMTIAVNRKRCHSEFSRVGYREIHRGKEHSKDYACVYTIIK